MNEFPKVLQPRFHNHPKKCKVCRHKKRDEIEYRYISGESFRFIVEDMNLRMDWTSIRRHVKAFGARQARSDHYIWMIETLLDKAMMRFVGDPPREYPSDRLMIKLFDLYYKITYELPAKKEQEFVPGPDFARLVRERAKKQIKRVLRRADGKSIDDL